MKIKKIASIIAIAALFTSLSLTLPASAQSVGVNANVNVGISGGSGQQGRGPGGYRMGGMRPAVVGTVSAVNGNSITVSGRQGMGSGAASVTYTVDATNAIVMKNNATSSVSNIATGDNVFVQGTVSGTNVTATIIRDGVGMRGAPGAQGGPRSASGTAPFVGNGNPIVAGKVASINGDSVVITNSSNVSYTVDATNAKVVEGNTAASISNIAVGDTVVVQGTINGNAIAASTIIDRQAGANSGGANPAPGPQNAKPKGFLAGIGQFFMHIFGF